MTRMPASRKPRVRPPAPQKKSYDLSGRLRFALLLFDTLSISPRSTCQRRDLERQAWLLLACKTKQPVPETDCPLQQFSGISRLHLRHPEVELIQGLADWQPCTECDRS